MYLEVCVAMLFTKCKITRQHFLQDIEIYSRPPDKRECWKTIFFISHPKHMLLVLKKKRLNKTVLLSTQNTCLK